MNNNCMDVCVSQICNEKYWIVTVLIEFVIGHLIIVNVIFLRYYIIMVFKCIGGGFNRHSSVPIIVHVEKENCQRKILNDGFAQSKTFV